MFEASAPVYVPILLPGDASVLPAASPYAACILSATYSGRPLQRRLCTAARRESRCLLVDPKTPYFQFEGYLSMEDARALPYSPGRATLGMLWEADDFASLQRRAELNAQVQAVQLDMKADLLMAPYFLIRDVGHRWLGVAVDSIVEALRRPAAKPIGAAVCVDLDAILDDRDRDLLISAFSNLRPALFIVTVVNFDERAAAPQHVCAVLDLIDGLTASGRPVWLGYTGRTGLAAVARGASGYCAGFQGLESHPLRFLREGLGSRGMSSYYLHEAMVQLPARLADAVIACDAGWESTPCDCAGCSSSERASCLVSRRLSMHAAIHRMREIALLAATPPANRQQLLIERLQSAIDRCRRAAAELADTSRSAQLSLGAFHYLEVIVEALGGPSATLLDHQGPI